MACVFHAVGQRTSNRERQMTRLAALLVAGVLMSACERDADTQAAANGTADGQPAAQPGATAADGSVAPRAPEGGVVVELIDREGNRVGGARLEQEGEGVRVSVRVTGLSGTHGLHFHETAQCDPPAFTSAGGHFAPGGRQHGFENPQGPHAGDLPNIRANEQGVADTTFVTNTVRLDATSQNGLLRGNGTALVVHAQADDYRTDPSGSSGDRIACGIVRGN
jgi:superoxide dismutase, Cu-Zn family